MAKVRSILQPVYPEDRHEKEISSLLRAPADRVLMSVAFVREEGIRQIGSGLSVNAKRTHVYVGVRNGITTVQAVVALLRAGTTVYAVDTGYGAAIFHSKFYCSIASDRARLIIGSANLTFSGLNNNLEASALLELDRTDPSDRTFLDRLVRGVEGLTKDFPDHCYRIKGRRHALKLLAEGLLEDERISRPDTAPTPGRLSASSTKIIPKIGLKFKRVPKRSAFKKFAKPKVKAGAPASAGGAPAFGPLLWEKPGLRRTDLQLLTEGHNPGVLRLTQARFEVEG
ncbi:MAG: phospholipase D family protein, partial [Gammaproteobacteria bacterium]